MPTYEHTDSLGRKFEIFVFNAESVPDVSAGLFARVKQRFQLSAINPNQIDLLEQAKTGALTKTDGLEDRFQTKAESFPIRSSSGSGVSFTAITPAYHYAERLYEFYWNNGKSGLSEARITDVMFDFLQTQPLTSMPNKLDAAGDWVTGLVIGFTTTLFPSKETFRSGEKIRQYPLAFLLPDTHVGGYPLIQKCLKTALARRLTMVSLAQYINPWKLSFFGLFQWGHHHNARAEAVLEAIKFCYASDQIREVLSNQQAVMSRDSRSTVSTVSVSPEVSEVLSPRWSERVRHLTQGGYFTAVESALAKFPVEQSSAAGEGVITPGADATPIAPRSGP